MEQRQRVFAAALTAGSVVAACHLISKYYTVKAIAQDNSSRAHSKDFFEFVQRNRTSQDDPALLTCANSKGITYDWAQSFEEILIEISVPASISSQDVSVKFGSSRLFVQVGQQVVIDGVLAGSINPQSSNWQLEGRRHSKRLLSVTLSKATSGAADKCYAIWQSLLVCDDDRRPASDQQRL